MTVRTRQIELTAIHSPFTTFCEGPDDVEKGFRLFPRFYRRNILRWLPEQKNARILVVSSGVGYFQAFLRESGYVNVLGIDSDPERVRHAKTMGFESKSADCFEYLEESGAEFDLIFAEQEINHLTRDEFLVFLRLCYSSLGQNGRLILTAANCANPLIASEYMGNNIDHYTSFAENNLRQYISLTPFERVSVFPHDFYVIWGNPLNCVAKAATGLIHLGLRLVFRLYGKSNSIFTKRLGVVAFK